MQYVWVVLETERIGQNSLLHAPVVPCWCESGGCTAPSATCVQQQRSRLAARVATARRVAWHRTDTTAIAPRVVVSPPPAVPLIVAPPVAVPPVVGAVTPAAVVTPLVVAAVVVAPSVAISISISISPLVVVIPLPPSVAPLVVAPLVVAPLVVAPLVVALALAPVTIGVVPVVPLVPMAVDLGTPAVAVAALTSQAVTLAEALAGVVTAAAAAEAAGRVGLGGQVGSELGGRALHGEVLGVVTHRRRGQRPGWLALAHLVSDHVGVVGRQVPVAADVAARDARAGPLVDEVEAQLYTGARVRHAGREGHSRARVLPPARPAQTDLRQRGGLQARAGGAERGQPARAAAGDAWMLKRAGSATLAHADGNSTRCHWGAATGACVGDGVRGAGRSHGVRPLLGGRGSTPVPPTHQGSTCQHAAAPERSCAAIAGLSLPCRTLSAITSGWPCPRWRYLQPTPDDSRPHVPLLMKSKHSCAPGPGSGGMPGSVGAVT